MGTNYYLLQGVNNKNIKDAFKYLKSNCYEQEADHIWEVFYSYHKDNAYHIGKSSFGWTFALHIDPDKEFPDFKSIKQGILNKNNIIINEYDEIIKPKQMLNIITKRDAYKHTGHELKKQTNSITFEDKHYCYVKGEFS